MGRSIRTAVLVALGTALASVALPGQHFLELPRHGIPGSRSIDTLGLIDLDGDRDLDVVLGYSDRNSLRAWINRDGYFQEQSWRVPVLPLAPISMATGDVDGDGNPDMVVGALEVNHGNEQNRLLLSDGKGHLVDATSRCPAIIDPTVDTTLVDVDHDGDLDVVVANYDSPQRLWLNDGKGYFTDVSRVWIWH